MHPSALALRLRRRASFSCCCASLSFSPDKILWYKIARLAAHANSHARRRQISDLKCSPRINQNTTARGGMIYLCGSLSLRAETRPGWWSAAPAYTYVAPPRRQSPPFDAIVGIVCATMSTIVQRSSLYPLLCGYFQGEDFELSMKYVYFTADWN